MIGERLNELRKDKGMTQQELGELLSVSKYTISSYENDKTSPDDHNKVLLAKIFDVSLDYLCGLIDVPVSYQRGKNDMEIPKDFSQIQLEQIQEYIEFLKYNYTRIPNSRNEICLAGANEFPINFFVGYLVTTVQTVYNRYALRL